jgi:hypothetical protein
MTVRVVLDTNVVLSALLFPSGRLAWLREAWQVGRVVPVVCRETTAELLSALAYPKFRLSVEEREELLADFLPYVEVVARVRKGSRLKALLPVGGNVAVGIAAGIPFLPSSGARGRGAGDLPKGSDIDG